MRSSILVLAAGLAAVGVACTAVSAGDPADAQEPPRAEAASGSELLRDLEIMRRLLAREALGTGDASALNKARYATFYVTNGSTDRAVEAFHVKGAGAVFVVRTSDAVAPGPGAPKEDVPSKPEPTAWDRIADEVEGRPQPVFDHLKRKREALQPLYDAAKVDALRDRILEQLAKYGDRLRGLGADEHLTVIVVGGGPQRFSTVTSALDALVAQADGTKVVIDTQYGTPGQADRTVMTLRTTLADCRSSAKGELDLAEFRRRAVVAQY